MQGTRGKGRTRISRRRIERASRIVRLQCDVQLAEDYYLPKWEREEYCERDRKGEEREREGNKGEEKRRRGGEGNVTSSIMVQLLLCTTYSD